MENTMNQRMKQMLSENLNFDLFYSISISTNGTRLIAEYSEVLEKYLLNKSFEQKDYLYADDDEKLELQNSDASVRVVLMKD
jgi:hypothetical protein